MVKRLRLPFRIPFFRIFYSTTYTTLFLLILLLLAITPATLIYTALRASAFQYVFEIGGVYVLVIIFTLFIYSSRLYTNRSVLAAVGKSWIPVQPGEVSKNVRKEVVKAANRCALIAFETKPRNLQPELIRLKKQDDDSSHDGHDGDSTSVGKIVQVDPQRPPWGRVSHAGWSSPSQLDANLAPHIQFRTVVMELPNLVEARAVSLAPPDTSFDIPKDGTATADEQVVSLLSRKPTADMRSYLAQLSSLGLIPPDAGQDFVQRYEHAHFVRTSNQIRLVSLPWFLSLYINSMPLMFAFRVLDVFFLEGPKVLFQIGLAILRVNGEELLDATDDGTFISVLKSYFARLGESAHPRSENPKLRAVTNFQALMVVAFKEFSGITQQSISDLRAKHKDAVLDNIESFAKRTSIRNLGPESKKLSTLDLGFLYDRFYGVLYERQQRMEMIQQEQERKAKAAKTKASEIVSGIPSNVEKGRVGLGPSPTEMDYDSFREFLAGLARWAITDSPSSPAKQDSEKNGGYFSNTFRARSVSLSPWGSGPEPTDHEFMKRLFKSWDTDNSEALNLQKVVAGFARIKGPRDIMSNISYFFDLYDDDNDGKVDREGILRISEALLFLSRRGVIGVTPSASSTNLAAQAELGPDGMPMKVNKDEQFLSSISAFIRRCFEYADPDQSPDGTEQPSTDATAKTEKESEDSVSAAADNLNSFSIGDDDDDEDAEEDLVKFDEDEKTNPESTKPQDDDNTSVPSITKTPVTPISNAPFSFGQTTPSKNASANKALDPNHPLFITLPTFRMLILADEALETFFDSGFPNSFHLADAPLPAGTVSTANLTTFSNLPAKVNLPVLSPGGPGAGVMAPGKGLRGMLDNIVTDGMRVAAEVRRRMDEAQREIDRGASTRGTESDDEEEDEGGRDLLEGAEVDAAAPPPPPARTESIDAAAEKTMAQEVEAAKMDKGKGKAKEIDDIQKSTVFER
ncbi:GTPase-activating protein GYP5 [Aureobasidium pullulans]|nr:GTPase-activating protein GYP5 [Aureobasidium pullulans]